MLLDGTALVANAIYIYLVLVFGSIILASVLLTIRGFVKKGKSIEVLSPNDKFQILDTGAISGSRMRFQYKTDSSRAISPHKAPKELGRKSLLDRWRGRNEPIELLNDPNQNIDEDERSSVTANDQNSSSPEAQSNKSLQNRTRILYLIEDLINMKKDFAQLPFEPIEIRLSELLIPSIVLPPSRITNKYSMDQELGLAQILLNDPLLSNRCLGLFRVVCAASFQDPYTNAQHFHGGLCDLLETIIDTLVIYSATSTYPSLQLALLDLAFTFLWEHWNWDQGFRLAVAAKLARDTLVSAGATAGTVTIQEATGKNNFEVDKNTELAEYELNKHVEPIILLEVTVFRLFCNLYLGTPVMAKPIRNRCIFKLSGVFYCCASVTKCNLHVELSRLLEQALSSTERDSIKVFFYEVLLKVLQPHLYCCIQPDDVFSNGSIIQKLIFQGLWTDQPPSVREKAADVVTVLSERFQEIVSWNKSMKFTHLSDDHGTGHGGAPGSWLNFK